MKKHELNLLLAIIKSRVKLLNGNLADCFILLLVIFLTQFMDAFTATRAQAGTLEGDEMIYEMDHI